jgi:hypothetical protein
MCSSLHSNLGLLLPGGGGFGKGEIWNGEIWQKKLYQILPWYLRTEAIYSGVMVVAFAVYACLYATMWKFCAKFCHGI